jgi:hypothetical protein
VDLHLVLAMLRMLTTDHGPVDGVRKCRDNQRDRWCDRTAGIMLLAPVVELDLNDLDRMHRTNIRGAFVVAQLAARHLRRGGALINFSSSVTRLQQPGYAASKGAVEAITMILARELRGRNITVNTVAPGPTATPLFLDGKPPKLVDRLAALSPIQRLGTANEGAGGRYLRQHRNDSQAESEAFASGPGQVGNAVSRWRKCHPGHSARPSRRQLGRAGTGVRRRLARAHLHLRARRPCSCAGPPQEGAAGCDMRVSIGSTHWARQAGGSHGKPQ